MKYLILVKHSLPEIIPSLPARHWRLSDVGRMRCKPLAEAIAAYKPDFFVSSAEPKAVETAQAVTQHLDCAFEVVEGLHEHERHHTAWESQEQFEARVAEFFWHPQAPVFGNETAAQAEARFSAALAGVLAEHPRKTLVVVAHGTVITLWVARATGVEPFSFWKRLGLPSLVVLSLPDMALATVVETIP
ncbi:MAG: histidine phosphatase family protein [Anaerolineae bacterium]|nr:histidine phosphatase family protein [Anaerolineae bacterium]